MSILKVVRESLQAHVAADGVLVVGVSGGADSLALLHALAQLWPRAQLAAAHLDHQLRPESAADADFVAETAVSFQVPFFSQQIDVASLAQAEKRSLEAAARVARYRFLAAVAADLNAAAVLTAHHADDQAETVLLHLIRGSGLIGLRGMQPASPLPTDPERLLLRPFLPIPRAAITAYCEEHNLQPRHDASNDDPAFLRNRVRHELLPLLADYNPAVRQRLTDLAAIVAADVDNLMAQTDAAWDELVSAQSETAVSLNRAAWQALPLSLRRLTLRRAAAALPGTADPPSFAVVEQMRALAEAPASGAQVTLPGASCCWIGRETVTFTTDLAQIPADLPQLVGETAVPLPVPGEVALAHGWRLTTRWLAPVDWAQVTANPDPWRAYLAADVGPLWVRGRVAGERFQPLGMNGRSSKLKKAMIERYLPAPARAHWPLVANADHLLWITGHHTDHRVQVHPGAARCILVECKRG